MDLYSFLHFSKSLLVLLIINSVDVLLNTDNFTRVSRKVSPNVFFFSMIFPSDECAQPQSQSLLVVIVTCLTLTVQLSRGSDVSSMDAPLTTCTKVEQRALNWFLWTEVVRSVEIHPKLSTHYGDCILQQQNLYESIIIVQKWPSKRH
jgi:hypothetical protein